MTQDKGQALIVDDEINLREGLAELVGGEGLRVIQASDGEQALTLLRDGSEPDVIFLDVRMPRVDGLEVLRVIEQEELTSAPVVVISAFSDSSKMIEAMRLGAYDYITKPLDLDEIVSILHRAVEQRRLAQASELQRQSKQVDDLPSDRFQMLGSSRA